MLDRRDWDAWFSFKPPFCLGKRLSYFYQGVSESHEAHTATYRVELWVGDEEINRAVALSEDCDIRWTEA
jgi:hypothetical protein